MSTFSASPSDPSRDPVDPEAAVDEPEDTAEDVVAEPADVTRAGDPDFDESHDNIIPEANGRFRVKAQTEIADFNAHFGTQFPDDEFDTVGGLVLTSFGRLPKRGEATLIGDLRFRVLRADSRRLLTLQVERIPPSPVACRSS